MKTLVALLFACSCAVAAQETFKDSKGRPMVPFAKPKCALMYEVVKVRAMIFKSVADNSAKLVFAVTFIQRKADDCDVAVFIALGGLDRFASGIAEKVPRDRPYTACVSGHFEIVGDNPGKDRGTYERMNFNPIVTFGVPGVAERKADLMRD